MDWQQIRQALCDGRHFSSTARGYSAIADTMMPSGAVIEVFMQADHQYVTLHDGGAAFDELARHGREVRTLRGVRNLLREIGLRVTDDGTIFMDRVEPENVAGALAVIADASLRSAYYLLQHAAPLHRVRLDRRVKDILRLQFPNGRAEYSFEGKRRQHTFDFGFELDQHVILVEAVTPDITSISSAIVKSMDATNADRGRARPILVYDRDDEWNSADLGLLSDHGKAVAFDRLTQADWLLAA